jgi:hypothetical protein
MSVDGCNPPDPKEREKGYWLTQPIEARLAEVERLRVAAFGIEACSARIQHVVRVIPLSEK